MKVFLHHNFINKILILLSTSIFLISCSTTKSIQKSEINPVYITNTKKFYLLSPENIQGNIDKVQLLQGSFGDNSFSINSYLQADSNGIFLSLFNDLGSGMGDLNYDGNAVLFESSIFPKKLKAEYIIADLQFAYYKSEALQQALSLLGLDFSSETLEDGTKVRLIKNKNNIIEEIKQKDGVLTIENKLRNYKYVLTEGE